MKIGVSGQSLGKILGLEETITFLRELNVKCMEVWPCNLPVSGDSVFGDTYENRNAERAARILEEGKIQVSAVSFSGAFSGQISGDEKRYSRELVRAVETAHILGAGIVNHYCYFLSLHSLDLEKLKRCMSDALRLAKQYGITMVLENEAHDMTKTPPEMKRIVEAFHDSSFQTNYDAVNYYEACEEGFPYAYDVLKDYIGYVHIKNGCRSGSLSGKKVLYTSIEEGAVNIRGLLDRLRKDCYQGYCIIEPHCPPEEVREYLRRDIDWLQKNGYMA